VSMCVFNNLTTYQDGRHGRTKGSRKGAGVAVRRDGCAKLWLNA